MRVHPVQNEADRSRDEGRCVHCLLRIPTGDLVTHTVEGEELDFCCHGCRIAYTIIHGAGLGAFYDKRKWEQAGTPEGVFDRRFDDAYLEKFVSVAPQGTGGGSELALLVEGIRCASCVWVIEKILSGIDGISKARLSYSSHLLAVVFDPEKITPSEVVGAVCSLGYLARPYTITAVEEMERKTKRALLVRFGTAAFLSMQLMGFSIALYSGDFHGIDFESRQMLQWFAFAVSTPVVFYCGWPFLSGGLRALSNRVPDMDLLIAIGVSASYGYSVFSLLFRGGDGEVYFDSSAMIVTFLLVGRLFENMARGRAAAGVHRLMGLAPDTAHRIEVTPEGVKGEKTEKINDVESSALAAGELIRVMPGERFPADGVVKAGVTEVDEAAVTGEPYPVARGPGAKVTSGTMNMSAAVDVLVTGAGADAFVARMAKLVESSQARKPAVQRLADRVAALFVPVVLSIAALTAGGWLLAGAGVDRALLNAVAVLVVACPCALGLATPTAIVVATGRAASRGILFRGGDVLERLASTTHAAFDKTGTLTVGKPVVCGVDPLDEISEDEVVATAARAELGSNHPIARAIVNEGDARSLLSPPGDKGKSGAGAVATPGLGVTLKTGDGVIRVGNKTFMEAAKFLQNKTGLPQNNIKVPLWEEHPTQLQAWVALDGRLLGRIRMEDELRPEAAAAIKRLKRMGFKTLILTGDTLSAGERMGRLLGIDVVHSHLDPEAKAKIVRGEQRRSGDKQRRSGGVLMVGDGINDAAALGEASVGCAIGGATDVALETADLVLVHPNLGRVAEAVVLARRTLAVIKQNLGWAFVYNVAALTLAVSGRLEPIHAAAAMALSSVCVVANSLRLSKGKV